VNDSDLDALALRLTKLTDAGKLRADELASIHGALFEAKKLQKERPLNAQRWFEVAQAEVETAERR
jgi:hypothetical protein